MKLLYNDIFLEHDTGLHPENKKRLYAFADIAPTNLEDGEQYLSLVHPPHYIDKVRSICAEGGAVDFDTITSTRTFEVAAQAVAAAVKSFADRRLCARAAAGAPCLCRPGQWLLFVL
jgi:acetoin utilization deacetylase AcuC-like enzyme